MGYKFGNKRQDTRSQLASGRPSVELRTARVDEFVTFRGCRAAGKYAVEHYIEELDARAQ